MKGIKVSLTAAAAALLLSSPAMAFHSGGVAECEGCHTMHNSEGGVAVGNTPQYQPGKYLLKGSDQSSTCLNCHQHAGDTGPTGYHISTADADMPTGSAPLQRTPGGDFGWLKKSYDVTVRGTLTKNGNPGNAHGHNIVAADYGYTVDPKTTAPGGTYPAANLACSSCHDPHGKYRRDDQGNITTTGLPIFNSGSYDNSAAPVAGKGAVGVYRILGGIGYQPKSLSGSFAFTNTVPAAVAPSTYNRTEATTQTRVAYGQGMSEWCANCHSSMLDGGYTSGMGGLVHPAGNGAKLTAAIASNYNAYVMSGNLSNTDNTKSYSSLVPFEEGTADYTMLKSHAKNDNSYLNGPDTTANVNCLSCHRAHASGFASMTRYNLANEFMTIADASGNSIYDPSTTENKVNQGLSVAEQTAAYYDRPATVFAPNQRDLCNKCHAKD